MLCSDIITKEKLKDCFDKIIINKEDLLTLSKLFDLYKKNRNKNFQDYISYSLYNDDLSIIDVKNNIENGSYDNITSDPYDLSKCNYTNLRKRHVRDYITTLTSDNYPTENLINEQIDAIDNSLTETEKAVLQSMVSSTTVRSLIQFQTGKTITHAAFEDTFYKQVSMYLNNDDASIRNAALSIFYKISMGTIH